MQTLRNNILVIWRLKVTHRRQARFSVNNYNLQFFFLFFSLSFFFIFLKPFTKDYSAQMGILFRERGTFKNDNTFCQKEAGSNEISLHESHR